MVRTRVKLWFQKSCCEITQRRASRGTSIETEPSFASSTHCRSAPSAVSFAIRVSCAVDGPGAIRPSVPTSAATARDRYTPRRSQADCDRECKDRRCRKCDQERGVGGVRGICSRSKMRSGTGVLVVPVQASRRAGAAAAPTGSHGHGRRDDAPARGRPVEPEQAKTGIERQQCHEVALLEPRGAVGRVQHRLDQFECAERDGENGNRALDGPRGRGSPRGCRGRGGGEGHSVANAISIESLPSSEPCPRG